MKTRTQEKEWDREISPKSMAEESIEIRSGGSRENLQEEGAVLRKRDVISGKADSRRQAERVKVIEISMGRLVHALLSNILPQLWLKLHSFLRHSHRNTHNIWFRYKSNKSQMREGKYSRLLDIRMLFPHRFYS